MRASRVSLDSWVFLLHFSRRKRAPISPSQTDRGEFFPEKKAYAVEPTASIKTCTSRAAE